MISLIRAVYGFAERACYWIANLFVFTMFLLIVVGLVGAIIFHPVVRLVSGGVLLVGGGAAIYCWRLGHDADWEWLHKGRLRVMLLAVFLASAGVFLSYITLGHLHVMFFASDSLFIVPWLRGGRIEGLTEAVGHFGQPIGIALLMLIMAIISGGILLAERDDGTWLFDEEKEKIEPGSPILQSRPVALMGDVRRVVVLVLYVGAGVLIVPFLGGFVYSWLFLSDRVEIPSGIELLKAIPVIVGVVLAIVMVGQRILRKEPKG